MTALEPGQMEFVQSGYEIDLRNWDFFDDDSALDIRLMMKGFAAQVTDVLREVFKNDPPKLMLPFQYAPWSDGGKGKPVDDPLMLYVDLPLGAHSDCPCSFACSLESAIDEMVDWFVGGDGFIDSNNEVVPKVAVRLRELADKLDKLPRREPRA